MKLRRSIVSLLVIMALTITTMGISLVPASAATKIKLSSTSTTVYMWESKTLTLKGTSEPVTWTSSNTAVATVDAKGSVYGNTAGTAKIKASVVIKGKTKTYTCKVTVKKRTLGTVKGLKIAKNENGYNYLE